MDYTILSLLSAVGLFIGMLLFMEIGRRAGIRRIKEDPESARSGLGTVDGAAFALFGLLIAFTFFGAASRFNWRRELILDEANAIGTAYLRLELLPTNMQPALRDLFRKYLDSRLLFYAKLSDIGIDAAMKELAVSTKLQGQIWTQAIAATRAEGAHPNAGMLLLPALNEMSDITTTRTMAIRTHPPPIILILLFGLGLFCAVLAGYGMASTKRRAWIHVIGFVAITVITIYVILDMEHPRWGLIRIGTYDQVLIELRENMK